MDIKLKNKLETGITIVSLIASIIGMLIIGIEAGKAIYENYDNIKESIRLIKRLF